MRNRFFRFLIKKKTKINDEREPIAAKELDMAIKSFNEKLGSFITETKNEEAISSAGICVEGIRFHQKIDRAVVIRRIEEQAQRQLKSQASFLYEDFQRTERQMNGKIFRLEEALRQSHRRHAEDLIAWAGEGRRPDAGIAEKIREFDADMKAGFGQFDPGARR